MQRRHLIAVGGACLLGPSFALAQARKYRIGLLGGSAADASVQRNAVEPFREALRGLGYVEGQNVELHFRWADGQPDRLPGLAAELLALKLSLIHI